MFRWPSFALASTFSPHFRLLAHVRAELRAELRLKRAKFWRNFCGISSWKFSLMMINVKSKKRMSALYKTTVNILCPVRLNRLSADALNGKTWVTSPRISQCHPKCIVKQWADSVPAPRGCLCTRLGFVATLAGNQKDKVGFWILFLSIDWRISWILHDLSTFKASIFIAHRQRIIFCFINFIKI